MQATILINNLPSKVEINLSGYLTVQNIGEILDNFKNASQELKNIEIIHHEVESIDLAYLQCLFALKTQIQNNQLKLSFSGNLNENIQHLISLSGLENQIFN
jgi:ABC-type transporter Mla MlaB component